MVKTNRNMVRGKLARLSDQTPPGGDGEPLVDAERAAVFLCLRPRRVMELARHGAIPAYPLGGVQRRLWRFRISELARLCLLAEYNSSGSLTCLEEKSHMAQRHQRSWLKKERRKDGKTWMLFFRTTGNPTASASNKRSPWERSATSRPRPAPGRKWSDSRSRSTNRTFGDA